MKLLSITGSKQYIAAQMAQNHQAGMILTTTRSLLKIPPISIKTRAKRYSEAVLKRVAEKGKE